MDDPGTRHLTHIHLNRSIPAVGDSWPEMGPSCVHRLMTQEWPAERSLLVVKGWLISGIQIVKDKHILWGQVFSDTLRCLRLVSKIILNSLKPRSSSHNRLRRDVHAIADARCLSSRRTPGASTRKLFGRIARTEHAGAKGGWS